MQVFQVRWVWLSLLVAALLLGVRLQDAWGWNSRALLFLKGQGESIAVTASDCGHIWLAGAEAGRRGDLAGQHRIWEQALGCSPGNLSMLRALLPQDMDMTLLATQYYPEQAEAWFWLAELQQKDSPEQAINSYWQGLQRQPHNSSAWIQIGRTFASLDPEVALTMYERLDIEQLVANDPLLRTEVQFVLASILSNSQPDRAIQLYRQGLQHKPHDGVRWRELGDLLSRTDPRAALEAYLESCYNGDPGSNGCYGAGRMMEKLGDPQQAIEYYRRSHWEGALNRADELEKQLIP